MQTILMKYHASFVIFEISYLIFDKSGKMLQNLSSAAVLIGALRANQQRA